MRRRRRRSAAAPEWRSAPGSFEFALAAAAAPYGRCAAIDCLFLRLLLISDIHANLEALDAVLASAAGRYDGCVCLGDVVGYGADPNATTRRVRELAALVIRGNHDRACASLEGVDTFTALAAAAARWTYEQLQPELRQWLTQLPRGPLDWEGARLAHGSPTDEDEYVIGAGQAALLLAPPGPQLTFIGHTHLQGGYVIDTGMMRLSELQPFAPLAHGQADLTADSAVLPLTSGERYLINPGSVGQPRDGDPRAAYAIWDDVQNQVTFCRVPYDLRRAQQKIIDAGLPERLAARLAQGQ